MFFSLIPLVLWGFVSIGDAASLKVGVTAGPHAMIMDQVKQEAAKEGIEIDIIEFNDFLLPNAALDEGKIDVNSYQHTPFLKEEIAKKNYKLVEVAKTVLMPMGIYSSHLKKISDLKKGAKVALPNDPTNGGRSLKLLESQKLISLKGGGSTPSILDISDNPKDLQFIEMESPQLVRSLEDVDIAVINTDWVVLAQIDPHSALAMESKDNPYTNILVVREGDEAKEEILKFIKIYHLPAIKSYIDSTFKGALLPSW